MSLLDSLGLEREDGQSAPAATATPVAPEVTPEPPVAPPAEPLAEPPSAEEEIVVPEGAENPDAVRNAIAAERKRARDAYAKAKQLERELAEREEASKPLEERLSGATKRAEAAELHAMRIEVGVATGLPLNLAKRLSGTTAEELAADAAVLIAEIGARKSTVPVPTLDGGPKPPPPAPPSDPTQAHNSWLLGAINAKRNGA